MRTSHRHAVRVTTTRTKPSLFSRLTTRRAAPTRSHHTTAAPVHHKRRPSIGDKIAGALMRLKGSLTRRPGVKGAGTRRMHGTDGRGSHRHTRRI